MQKIFFNATTYYLLVILGLFSCTNDSINIQESPDSTSTQVTANAVKGMVRVKLNQEQANNISVTSKSGKISSSINNIDNVLTSISALSFKRTFPNAGRFEARSKKKGLHLWYDITYDTTQVSLSNVIQNFGKLSEVDVTEPIKIITSQKATYKQFEPHPFSANQKSATLSSSSYPFNDPGIASQWHYYNSGSVIDSEVGCDINLFNAWNYETGNEDVIVAIVDAGIDVDHEDLSDNIWVNTSEKDGSLYTDDDNNGYKDDVNGFNFVSNDGAVTAEYHGTHVAGTIGAVNNNKKGVCGIAGGNGDTPGVKLMSCQVFETDDEGNELSAKNFAEAIKYAADNGAVICQCSWGYDDATSLPRSMKDAIDYFIEYAGMDENDNQEGPMAGGVVIFAAGNDAVFSKAYPAMYSAVVAVASCGADYTISYYSNYGNWVDITATGGTDTQEGFHSNWIVSTAPNNEYGYLIGTSMACPHVSGVAALIVSKYGDVGFTPDQLKARLFQGTINLDEYNPGYIGKYGVGLMNAAGALANSNSIPPEAVTDLTVSVARNVATLSWTVTKDEDDGKPMGYKLYYATSPISDNDIESDSPKLGVSSTLVGLANVGDDISAIISDLEFTTDYYFRIVGYDVLSTFSEASNEETGTTGSNSAPIITSIDGDVFTLKSHESQTIAITILDPDGDDYSWSYSDEAGGSSAAESAEGVDISINALLVAAPGVYNATLHVVDEFNATATFSITYTVLTNTAPVIITPIENVYIGNPESSYTLDLSTHFYDADGEELKYNPDYSPSYLYSPTPDQNLTITPISSGLSTYSLTAYDARKEQVTSTFLVMVRDDTNEIDVYPNPVIDTVHFRMGENIDGDLKIEVYNDNGVLVKDFTTEISTFSPANADLSSLASGQYLLKLNYNNQEYVRNIVKL